MRRIHWASFLALFLAVVLAACDSERVLKLEEGVATEADVRAQFGEPFQVWEGANGERIFEYPRQPDGHRNYMITIGTDGKMSALRQVLTAENFAKVTPGMMMEDVRKLLGEPMSRVPYELSKEVHYNWRYMDGTESRIFTTIFSSDLRVLRVGSALDVREQGGQGR